MYKYRTRVLRFHLNKLVWIHSLVVGKKAALPASVQERVYTLTTTTTAFQYKNKTFKLTIHTQQLKLQVS